MVGRLFIRMKITVELSGGAELLFGNQRKHDVTLPDNDTQWTMASLLPWIRDNLLQVLLNRRSK